jgi:hypothetical protein
VQRFFAAAPVEESRTRVPVWSLRKHLHQHQPQADLTLCGLDVISAWLFAPRHCLALPPLVSAWMAAPSDAQPGTLQHGRTESDFRRVRRQGFGREFSTSAADFDFFYTRCYRPYIHQRHGRAAELAPRWMLRLVHRCGGILWITRQGERLAGDIILRRGAYFTPVVTGLLDGREDLLRQGALTALYVHGLEQARELGCTRILLGGSRPSLHDGVLRYKAKWLDGLMPHAGPFSSNHTLLVHWPRLSASVAGLLGHTSLIHREQGCHSALWAFPPGVPLTAETLQQHLHALKLRGLHRFRILLPGDAPEGFACPHGVRLVPMASVAQCSPAQLLARVP